MVLPCEAAELADEVDVGTDVDVVVEVDVEVELAPLPFAAVEGFPPQLTRVSTMNRSTQSVKGNSPALIRAQAFFAKLNGRARDERTIANLLLSSSE